MHQAATKQQEFRPVEIIAECGVNHNGDIDLAIELVRAAAKSGADIVKFQTFKADKLATSQAPRSPYQDRNTKNADSQLEMLSKLELTPENHKTLLTECDRLGVEFMSSPFDEDSARFLAQDLAVKRLKLGSGELTNALLLLQCSQLQRPIIMSTGMATLGEVEQALAVMAFGLTNQEDTTPGAKAFAEAFASQTGQQALRENISLLHCTTDYPSRFEEVNLAVMDTLHHAFGLPVGFSDHTPGIAIPVAAVARGATIIEKHFTTDTSLPGPDHKASLEPQEFAQMVSAIRQLERAIGQAVKVPVPSELCNVAVARKSLVAATPIKAGEKFTTENLTVKRPGTGVSSISYWDFIGKPASRNYNKDELIDP